MRTFVLKVYVDTLKDGNPLYALFTKKHSWNDSRKSEIQIPGIFNSILPRPRPRPQVNLNIHLQVFPCCAEFVHIIRRKEKSLSN